MFESFSKFISDLDYLVVIDAVVFVLAIVPFFIFFYNKRQMKVFAIVLIILGGLTALEIVNVYMEKELFLIARLVMRVLSVFIVVACAVAYGSDLKTFFGRISSNKTKNFYEKGFGNVDDLKTASAELLDAVQDMAKRNTGAIILLTNGAGDFPPNILDTGTKLDADLSAGLLESIFNTKGPLHDGAVVVTGTKIRAAGCFLPLTQNINVGKEFGTRHRAAIGITEESDVIAIVVSEETGIISVGRTGELKRYMTMEKLKEIIEEQFGIASLSQEEEAGRHGGGRRHRNRDEM
ncbi:MAG: diadenylate cyclase [Clostridiaceae bacterium]|jgi:diadenylate cyclase|nr:diadenylate cyclase [Clostridiaceae bacterium]